MILGEQQNREKELFDAIDKLSRVLRDNFNLELSRIIYSKINVLDTVRFNQVSTMYGYVWIETDKGYKRRIYEKIRSSVENTILEDLK